MKIAVQSTEMSQKMKMNGRQLHTKSVLNDTQLDDSVDAIFLKHIPISVSLLGFCLIYHIFYF